MPKSVHKELARLADLHQTTMSDYAVAILVQHFEARKSKGDNGWRRHNINIFRGHLGKSIPATGQNPSLANP
jgi:hypothetical protein